MCDAGACRADSPVREKSKRVVRGLVCGVGLLFITLQTWLLNVGIFPVTSEVAPSAREIQTAVGVGVGSLVLLAAMRYPVLLKPRPLLAGAFCCLGLGEVGLLFFSQSAVGATFGLVLRALGTSPGFFLVGSGFIRLGLPRVAAIGACAALFVSTVVSSVVPAPSFAMSIMFDVLLAFGCYLLLGRSAREVFGHASRNQGAELLALASPRSFLAPSHQVYILMLIFSAAFGFALSLRIAVYTPVSSWVAVVALFLAVIWFVFAPGFGRHEDGLFSVAALLVVAGFLLAPVDIGVGSAVANGLLDAGNSCFRVLMWMSATAFCTRNPMGAPMVLACMDMAGGVGTFIGADLGHLCNALLGNHPEAAVLVTGGAVLVLFAYVLVGLRGFSFAETIGGVEPAPILPLPEVRPISRDARVEEACDNLAREGGLTEREREVLGMLARGYNGYRIRDELVVSYNTVKTHVKRIYRKLDVHGQQELINLVERRAGQGTAIDD